VAASPSSVYGPVMFAGTSSRRVLRRVVRRLIYTMPTAPLDRVARFYLASRNAEYDCDMRSNGEAYVASRIIPKSNTAVDVGGGRGAWSDLAFGYNPSVTIHCFEPSPYRCKFMEALEIKPNFHLNRFGLSHEPGDAQLHHGVEGSFSLFASAKPDDGRDAPSAIESVTLQRLDDYVEEMGVSEVDFMKLDVEGYELSVLRSAEKLLRRGGVKFIQFEYGPTFVHPGHFLKDLVGFVQGCDENYNLYKILPDRVRRQELHAGLETFATSHWMLARQDPGSYGLRVDG